MSDFVTLFCQFYGEPSERAFAVKIGRGESVSVLKKLIKEEKKNALKHLDADALDLWQVCIPWDDENGLKDFVLEDPKKLHPTWEIGSLFEGDPPKHHAHILVKGVV